MRILVGMSGGLDSTFAAYKLRSEGHEVLGAVLKMHEYTDLSFARESANAAGIPLVELDCTDRFEKFVISDFVDRYAAGRTPNPCVVCNSNVKFAALCDYARENGFDRVATGHYASIEHEGGRFFVRSADDASKDQSYVLWQLSQDMLAMLYLPLSGMKKSEIRENARALGFPCADAKESMDCCFIPDGDYASFVEKKLGKTFPCGDFVDENGNPIGRHRGIIHYTTGQRKGLGLSCGEPVFVTKIDPASNTVTVAPGRTASTTRFTVRDLNFQKLTPAPGTYELDVKIRYSAPAAPATVTVLPDAKTAEVTLHTPVRAVTPGQSAVFRDGRDLALGGIIY